MIGNWRAYLYDTTNNFVAELPFEGLSVVRELNQVYKASIRVNYHIFKDWMTRQNTTVEAVLTSGFRWVEIKRNSTTIFKGILTECPIQKFDIDINVTIAFKGWLAYYERRYITKTYTNTDAGAIGWDIINTAQSVAYGNIGITQGAIETTVNRDRTYNDDEIAKSLIALSNSQILNGFEFEITNDKVYTAKARLGADKPYIVFDRSNTKSWTINYKTSLLLTNKIKELGDGIGDSQISVTRESSNTYKDKWYLLEGKESHLSVKEQVTLEAYGDQFLSKNQDYSKAFKISVITNNIDLTEYDIGDKVKIEIEDLINGLYRIKTKEIVVNNGEESVNLEFLFN